MNADDLVQMEGVKAMELFGRELSLEQMIGLVECQATPDEDLVHRAALEIIAALRESQRRADAAVEDMKVMALAMRESEELSEGCCFACIYDGQNLPDNVIIPYGECPGYETDDCFEWRGPQDEEGEAT
jgi:hypothetical protein